MSGTTLPTLQPDTGAVTEDGTLTAAGSVLANDTDANGTLSVVSVNGTALSGATTVAGAYGTLVIQPNGSYSYTLNNAGAQVRTLQNAQTAPDSFTYVASDGTTYTQGGSQTIQNLITQSEAFNDPSWASFSSGGAAPVVTADTEAGPNGGAGTADALALGSANSGLYFKTPVSGSYTFSVWVRSVSGSGNFALGYYSGAANSVSTQAGVATATWQRFTYSFTGDANAISNVSIGLGPSQAAGGTFELWGAQLNPGASAQAYVPTTGAPATSTGPGNTPVILSSTLTINVTGNTPVAAPDTGAVTSNGLLTSTGNVLSNDTDGAGKTLSVASVNGTAVTGTTTVVGTYGTLVIQPGGQYTYTLNNTAANVQALAAGQVVQDPFNYVVTDGQSYLQGTTQGTQNLIPQSEAFDDPSWVKFALSGAAPVVAANADPGPNGGAVTADRLTLAGANSGLYFQTPVSGQHTFSVWVRLISGSGDFAFGYYSGAGNSVALQPAVATTGWQRLTWTFTGDGNAFSNLSLMHGTGQSTTGTLEFWGAQLNPGAAAQNYVPTSGSPVSVPSTSTAPAVIGATLSIAVTGAAGSSPPTAAPDTASVTEDSSTQVATGNVLGNDTAFGGRTLTVLSVNGVAVSGPTTVAGTYGTLVIQPNGQYTYTLGNAQPNLRALTNGQVVPDVFTYAITDGQTPTQSVTQTSQNAITQSEVFNAPVWTVFSATGLPLTTITANVGSGPNGGAGTADQLDLLGPNAGIFYVTNLSGQYTFSLWVRLVSGNPNITLSYYSGSANQSAQQTVTATGDWQRLSFTFTGDGNAGSNVALTHGTFQTGDTVLQLWGAQINSGAAAGTYTPTSGTAVNTSATTTVPISSTLTVSVNGVTPVAAPDVSVVTAGGATTATGNLLANDTDANALPLTLATVNGVAINGQTTLVGTYGTLVVQPNGQYTYTLASLQPNVQALSGGQTAADSFTYTVSDGQTHTLVASQVAQNLITQSEAFNVAPWTLFSPGALPVITANVDAGPQGGAATADRIALTVPGSGIAYATPLPGAYTFSAWVKSVGGSGAFTFNYLASTAGANYAQIATANGNWQRFSFSFLGDGSPNSGIALELGADQPAGTFELWGAQINTGTTANTYVATAGTAATTTTSVTTPAPAKSALTITVDGTDTGKSGPALNFQNSAQGIVANLATGQWSPSTSYMPLGDSITYGWSAQDAIDQSRTSEGYRGPLWSRFLAGNDLIDMVGDQSNGPPTLLDPQDAGYPGERTDQFAARLPGLLATQHPNNILLLGGINDLKQGFDPATVASNISGMLSTVAATSPTTRVYVALITPVTASVASAAAVSTANADIRTAVQNAAASGIKATLVDTSDVTLADIGFDGLHPAPSGYAKLAGDFYNAITATQPIVAGTPAGTANAISGSVVSLVGGSGNNLLIGDARANFLTAGSANDILEGGGGDDVLTGAAGQDEFVFTAAAGLVTVNNFNPAKGDYLDWDNIPGIASTSSVAAHATQVSGSTLVDLTSAVAGLKVKLANYTGDLSHSLFGPPVG
jgi:VCBS repeat-containing protein